ncbi:MAG: tyrosine--tRNA ligase [Candidatus Rokubacteria bacterium]|nr:tyrosine--tRNA ligase [Candidatus Rokubacteria bacterium]
MPIIPAPSVAFRPRARAGLLRVPNPCDTTPDALSSAHFADVDEQLRIIRRGTAEIVVEAELRQKLERSRTTGTPLLVKLGLDPTAPDLHLGHTVVLRKMRDFQDLGHQIVVIIGDFTGLIGDPTGRSETRKPLTWDEIRANAETYRAQLGKVLDMARVRVEFNSTWLSRLTFEDLIRQTAHLTVARILQREDFAARYAAGRAISLHEFLYPIAQAYDSVALRADVELGGTDQTFNLLVGRDLQRANGQAPQIALTVPILEGLDGVQKMSKSLGNYVGINEPPADVYGKVMSVSDALMWRYVELLTRWPEADIAALRREHPMDAKKRLAHAITAMYHGESSATDAQAHFERVFQKREDPDAIEEVSITLGQVGGSRERAQLVRVLVATGYVTSHGEARRMIQQGAVDVDGQRVSDVNASIVAGSHLVRVGKRQFKRVVLGAS